MPSSGRLSGIDLGPGSSPPGSIGRLEPGWWSRESTFAVFDQATGEVTTKRVVGRPHELLPWLRGIARPARMVYEAGPTGYGLARRARAEGIELDVCAPGKTDRPAADRVKTDKRDAIRLARLLAAGELTLVTIPSVEREQLRDLVRCREDIRLDLMRARNPPQQESNLPARQ